ncbi:thioredoxin-dependent thiol peroxidase [Gynurincola endophyticus]|jgi:peroxiredoxin Q/BCP|uniref:thioredoxin-dependent thiol peroxidase n=1 Tax=Gynurincola endophyticus TaxID=2479004 RepID=UPI0018F2D526|nr:thioredoxin-dependent thiol peroxidase [Gynurincola endophyticus]
MIQEGMKAPAFTGTDQNGEKIRLKDYKGKKIAVYFYPKDDTPACTAQACSLRDLHQDLLKAGIVVIGISPDTIEKHKKFESKYQLPFSLISDPEKNIIDAFGVWGEKKLYGKEYMGLIRTTFLIDEKGIVVKVIGRPKTKDHGNEILTAFGLNK